MAQAGFDAVFVLLLGALMLAYDLRLGLVALGMTAIRIVAIRLSRRSSEQRTASELAARGREQNALLEAASSPEMVKGLGLEAQLATRYGRRVADRAACAIRTQKLEKGVAACLSVLGGLMEATILWCGGGRVIAGEMSVGVFAGFLAIRSLMEAPIASLLSLFESWLQLRSVFERSDDVLSVAPVKNGSLDAERIEGRIEACNLGFRYGSGGQWVLRNVNFLVEPGQRVAFVGPSGQGKSTLAKLICGLLEPTEGEVLLDGVPIAGYDRASLAQRLGALLQEPLVLAGSIRDALCLRLPLASPAMVQEATHIACLEKVVRRQPEGYDGRLSAFGSNLSAGERQRLALAQVVLGSPSVLVLDEATCALDPETEERVLNRLDTLPSTIISVAHRPTVVAHASRVFAVCEGSVVEVPRQHIIPLAIDRAAEPSAREAGCSQGGSPS
jgi:ABC-type bacteriocin/lantibiotic exporter with double-glycine peptidase domain